MLWRGCVACRVIVLLLALVPPSSTSVTDEEFEFLCDAILLSRDGTEGPFYVQKDLLRSNITEDRRGLPLKLEIMVIDGECQPISDVWIDLWQADASGNYSGYQGFKFPFKAGSKPGAAGPDPSRPPPISDDDPGPCKPPGHHRFEHPPHGFHKPWNTIPGLRQDPRDSLPLGQSGQHPRTDHDHHHHHPHSGPFDGPHGGPDGNLGQGPDEGFPGDPHDGPHGPHNGPHGGPHGPFGGSHGPHKGPPQPKKNLHFDPTEVSTFLRGITSTDAHGVATVQTIFPGWYAFRAPHIHAKVHMPNQQKTWMGKALSMIPAHWSASLANLRQDTHVHHTTQIYFDNTLSQRVYSELSAYSERDLSTPERIAFNEDDCVFRDGGGEAQIAHSSEVNPSSLADGLTARVVLKLDTSSPMPRML